MADVSKSRSGDEEEPTAKIPSPSTLIQRKPAPSTSEDQFLPPLPSSTKLPPTQATPYSPPSKKPPSSSSLKTSFNLGFICTTLVIITAILLGIMNIAVATRVVFHAVQKSNAARRNRSNRHGSIEISRGSTVRLEEIRIVDGKSTQKYKGKQFSNVPNINFTTNGAFLIVEPRQHSLLPLVCAEFHKKVPPDWVLYIVHSYANAAYARKSVENIPRKKVFMQLNTNSLKVDDYNIIFKNQIFWEFINPENILVFQTDSVPCGPMLDTERYANQFGYVGCTYYDKVGPGTGYWDDGTGVDWSFYGSGGLSLRRKSFTLECLEWYKVNNREMHEYEDVTFSHCVDLLFGKLHYPKPTLDDVGDFCVQNTWGDVSREPRSFGAHQIGGQMRGWGLKRRLLEYCPMAALI